MLLSVVGVGTASAAISKSVGGGTWSYSLEPGRTVISQYYHSTRQHGSSARVGSGKIDRGCASKGKWSWATATGSGTRYAYWHSVCTSGHRVDF